MLAKQFQNMRAVKNERPLSDTRLDYHRRQIKAGLVRNYVWATALCVEDGNLYRANGNHSSSLIAHMTPMEIAALQVFIVVEEYEADTVDDVVRLWSTFDARESTRKQTDVNWATAATVPELEGMERQSLNIILGGIVWARTAAVGKGPPKSAAERAEYLHGNAEEAAWVYAMLGPRQGKSDKRWYYRVPVIAAMVRTMAADRSAAQLFWPSVVHRVEGSPESPHQRLAWFLATTRAQGGQRDPANVTAYSARNHATQSEVYAKCVQAWNAFRRGKATIGPLKYSPKDGLPEPI